MSKIINYIDECYSTQDIILENNHDLNNFYTVYTFNQLSGRGQNNSSWIIEKNKNIALSFILKDIEQKYLSFWVAVILKKFIYHQINIDTYIKWPNDIIIKNKKIAGILIENKKINNQNIFIIGIGININQINFVNIPNASSLKSFTKVDYNLHDILYKLMNSFLENINLLNENIIVEYNLSLYKKNKISVFELNKQNINGIIKEVLPEGEILIEFENEIKKFRNKEISLKIL